MTYQLLRSSAPLARKDHRCIWCGESIPKGTLYVHEISIFDGQLQNHHWHNECEGDAGDYFLQYGPEFNPYENPRGERIGTP